MVAAKLATLKRSDTLKKGDKNPDRSNDPSVADAATLLQVSEKTVKQAKQLIERGSKELVQAVERGKVNLNQAVNLVKQVESKSEQTKILSS